MAPDPIALAQGGWVFYVFKEDPVYGTGYVAAAKIYVCVFADGSVIITPAVATSSGAGLSTTNEGIVGAAYSSSGLTIYVGIPGEHGKGNDYDIRQGEVTQYLQNLEESTSPGMRPVVLISNRVGTITTVYDGNANDYMGASLPLTAGQDVHIWAVNPEVNGYDAVWAASLTIPALTPVATQLSAPTITLNTPTAGDTTLTPTISTVANASSYKLRYGTTSPPTGDGSAWTSGTAITGLAAGTYYVQTKSIGDGTTYTDSEWSEVASATLEAAAPVEPTAITDFTATANSSTTILCSFTLPTGVSNTATIAWQRSTVDPDSAGFNPATDWVTLATTDTSGNNAFTA